MADSFTDDQNQFLDWLYARFQESGRWPTQGEAEIALRAGPSAARVAAELMPAFVLSDGSSPSSTWQLTLRAIDSRPLAKADVDHFLGAVRLASRATIAAGSPVEISSEQLGQALGLSRLELDRLIEMMKHEEFAMSWKEVMPPSRTVFTPASFIARLDGVASTLDYWHGLALWEDEKRREGLVYAAAWSARHARAPRAVEPLQARDGFIDPGRLVELRAVQSAKFDLARLIRLCEELEWCYAAGAYLAVAALTRALMDHVPPIFGQTGFAQVASNYLGGRSFKRSMKHLEASARSIADAHLHGQVRARESLPTAIQVDFRNDIDVLLAEIVRILSERRPPE